MNIDRATARLVVTSTGMRSIIIYTNQGVLFIDNEYTAKKMAEEILAECEIGSNEVYENDELVKIEIGKTVINEDI